MKRSLIILTLLTVLAPRVSTAGVRAELALESPVLGSNIEPLAFPVGVSGRLLNESHVQGDLWFMAGVGCGGLWSEAEQFEAGEPSCQGRWSSLDPGPLRHCDMFMGICWQSQEARPSSYGEFLAGVTMVGRDELEGSLLVGFAAGYSWPLVNGVELVASVGQRVHLALGEGRLSISLALRRSPN